MIEVLLMFFVAVAGVGALTATFFFICLFGTELVDGANEAPWPF